MKEKEIQTNARVTKKRTKRNEMKWNGINVIDDKEKRNTNDFLLGQRNLSSGQISEMLVIEVMQTDFQRTYEFINTNSQCDQAQECMIYPSTHAYNTHTQHSINVY